MRSRKVTCQELIVDFLCDYLDASLGPDLVGALERHLQDCPPCLAYLNTYRKTREMTGKAARVEMPEEMKKRLRHFLLEHLSEGTR